MALPRLEVSKRLHELMSYDKLAGPEPRMLVLESQYWLDGACIRAAQALGWQVESTPVVMRGVLPREQIAGLFEKLALFKPDFILTVNMSGMDEYGLFARLFEDLRIPYVTWFVDNPRTILRGRTIYASAYSIALTWDEAYLDHLHQTGFPVVYVLPLAVDPIVFNAEPAETWDHPPTFVGNSNTSLAEEEWTWIDQRPRLAQAVREAIEAGRVTRHNFARGLEALLEADLLSEMTEDEKRHAELLFFFEGTRRRRLDLVRTLEPEGLEVRGDEDWRRTFAHAGGAVAYLTELPEFYRRCELNLNVTSIQMPTAPNQRVFDCPAAGGFLLTDAQPALGNLFELGKEAVCYSSVEECRELFRAYRRACGARRSVTACARKRILGEHTYLHRIQAIASIVRERFGS